MGKRSTLLWQLYGSALVMILLSVGSVAFLAFEVFRHVQFRSTEDQLKNQALLVESVTGDKLSAKDSAWIDGLCKRAGEKSSVRITVMLPSGEVLGDSAESLERMPERARDRTDRPEIKAAATGEVGVALRRSVALDRTLMYVAVPVIRNSQVVGMVRTATTVPEPGQMLPGAYSWVGLTLVAIALISALWTLRTSRKISKPIAGLREAVARFAGGDLHYRSDVAGAYELAQLALGLNNMALQLHEKLAKITRQRNELEALLSAMMEAVLVLDTRERLVRVNKSAEVLFGLHDGKLMGRNFLEVIRHTDLHEFVKKALASESPVESEIRLLGDPDRILRGHGTTLIDAEGHRVGALVVLHDITRIKRLEQIRKDFVANVSHELRTPITSIKGYLETLKEGAIDDPENALRFLDTIIKHTDRLSLIIDDLLSLSRLEKEVDRGDVKLADGSVCAVLEAAIKTCAERAEARNVSVTLDCDSEATARINPNLLEQALVNLLDNAIKYSDAGSCVLLTAGPSGGEMVIKVTDQGCGIPKESLTRIFERFYRVDKGRSRGKGGSGLGLSIVKHIANAHQGRVEVKSSPGTGSTFSLHLPLT